MKLFCTLCKWMCVGLLAVGVLGVIAAFGLMVWVKAAPRSLNSFSPYIVSILAPKGSDYTVKIGDSRLLWDNWEKPIAIHINDVAVHNMKGDLVATFPEIGITLNVYELLFGKAQLRSVEILRPDAVLLQGDDGSLSLGFNSAKGSDNALSNIIALMTTEKGDNPISHLRSFTILHASLTVKNSRAGVFLQSGDASLEMKREHGLVMAKLDVPVVFHGQNAKIEGKFTLDKRAKIMQGKIAYTDMPSEALYSLIPAQQWISGVHMKLSGSADVASDFNGTPSQFDFTADAGEGSLDFPEQFNATVPIQSIRLTGSLSDHFSTLTVRQCLLDSGGITVALNGAVHKAGDDYSASGNVTLQHAQVSDIAHYWPLKLAPRTRDWVVHHISGGTIPRAEATLDFQPGDFKLKNIPDKALSATIQVENTSVKYLPSHPPATNVNGTVKFTGNSMDARVTSAQYMTGTKVTAGRVRFPDFIPADVRLFIDLDVQAPAVDVVTFLSLPELGKAKLLQLSPDITGSVTGNVKFDLIAFSEKNRPSSSKHVNFSIAGNLQNVSQKAFLGNRDVAAANMKISANNKGLKLSGHASINQVPMQIDLTTTFADDHATKYGVQCEIPVERLPAFHLPALGFITGLMGVNASFSSSDAGDTAQAKLDLTNTRISLPDHHFMKKSGQEAQLTLSTQDMPSGDTRITSFEFKGNGLHASGEAEIDKASQGFRSIDVHDLQFADNDLETLHYERLANGMRLAAKGRAFDISPYITHSHAVNPAFSYDIDIAAGRLIMGEDRYLKNASIQANCAEHCNAVHLNAELTDGTPFRYTISNGNLTATCTNAGELARTLGIFDTMNGGMMTLLGKYDSGILSGTMEIKNYSLKSAPVLTRILTIASLTGVLDTVTGNGISFVRLSAPFIFHDDVLTLKDAKAHGAALGITAEGTVNMHNNTLDLKGTLVPSYTLNSLLSNVPLIGDMLMGGSGKGLFALSYSLRGDMKDPNIMINPLSVLTPGFIRNIFDIFDKPTPDLDKILEQEKLKTSVAVPGQPKETPSIPVTKATQEPALPTPPPAGQSLPPMDSLTH